SSVGVFVFGFCACGRRVARAGGPAVGEAVAVRRAVAEVLLARCFALGVARPGHGRVLARELVHARTEVGAVQRFAVVRTASLFPRADDDEAAAAGSAAGEGGHGCALESA